MLNGHSQYDLVDHQQQKKKLKKLKIEHSKKNE